MDWSFPKAELHLHLEGSLETDTLGELARRHGLPPPPADLYRYHDFLEFLIAFKEVTRHLLGPEDYALATDRLLARLREQNVVHAEIYFSAGICRRKGMEVDPIYQAIRDASRAADGLRVGWIFDAVRQFGAEAAEEVVRLAARYRDQGVVGIGIGGSEQDGPPRSFRRAFEMARAEGLRLTAHAGETTGPETIWETLRELGPDRIGHGTSAVRDPQLMAYLRDRQIPIEVSVTSNYATGAVAPGDQHPVRRMVDEGLLVVINSDDPAMFQTSLTEEYRRLVQRHGFSENEVRQLAANAFQAAFL
jgi:adenosine deaminase/aminodeoxyfutalosine deaminase